MKGKSYLDSVNRTKVTPEMLIEANQVVSDMKPEDRRDLTARTIRIIQLLDERGVKGRKRPDMLTAICFRLEALARLEVSNQRSMGAWHLPGDEKGMVFAHEDLFRAAALEPLIEQDNQAGFDADSFTKRLLSVSMAKGRG